MGNSPSTIKASHQQHQATSSTSSTGDKHGEWSRSAKRDTARHPIPVPNQTVLPPEPSLSSSQGTIHHKRCPPFRSVTTINYNDASSSKSTNSFLVSEVPQSQARPRPMRTPAEHGPSKPVDVPHASTNQMPVSPRSPFSDALDAGILHSSIQDMSYLTRPPRLPLPIEEEVHTPGSPINGPTKPIESLDDLDAVDPEGLHRRSSGLSATTLDEDDDETDAEELRVDKTRPTVPTRLEWLRGGEKVYVTGTIFQWNRKTRLHPVEGCLGVFAATINIHPGTHHIRFLVDGQMCTSPDLPSTVDFGNNLVNYIEINADDVPTAPPAKPDTTSNDAPKARPPVEPKRALSMQDAEEKPVLVFRDVPATESFASKIPLYLLDFDQPEDSPNFAYASSAIEKLPNPPALPGFLAKPILNAPTMVKDDNSVLNMPNHTLLNHLGTCSIKNNILAVSATTRYKDKYVTTIIYKPTTAEAS